MTEQTIDLLDDLALTIATMDALGEQWEAARERVLTDEQRAEIARLDDQYRAQREKQEAKRKDLEARIKTAVLEAGASVKGEYMQAIYNKGRVSWNNKALEGVAAIYPEVRALRKQGEPYVTLRTIS